MGIIEGSDNDIQVNIIPNPNHGTFKINILGINDDLDLYVINSNGAIVRHKKLINTNTPLFSLDFDMSNLSKGIYYFKFINNKIVHIEKVIVN